MIYIYFLKGIILLLFFTLNFNIFAQTGPGVGGSAAGTADQPKNVLWLDASTLILTDGVDLTTWTDLSGNNNNLTQLNTSFTPIFQDDASNINGYARAEFSKADNRIIINPFNSMPTSGITTFIVYSKL